MPVLAASGVRVDFKELLATVSGSVADEEVETRPADEIVAPVSAKVVGERETSWLPLKVRRIEDAGALVPAELARPVGDTAREDDP